MMTVEEARLFGTDLGLENQRQNLAAWGWPYIHVFLTGELGGSSQGSLGPTYRRREGCWLACVREARADRAKRQGPRLDGLL